MQPLVAETKPLICRLVDVVEEFTSHSTYLLFDATGWMEPSVAFFWSVACDAGWHLYDSTNKCIYSSRHASSPNLTISQSGASAFCTSRSPPATLTQTAWLGSATQQFISSFAWVVQPVFCFWLFSRNSKSIWNFPMLCMYVNCADIGPLSTSCCGQRFYRLVWCSVAIAALTCLSLTRRNWSIIAYTWKVYCRRMQCSHCIQFI